MDKYPYIHQQLSDRKRDITFQLTPDNSGTRTLETSNKHMKYSAVLTIEDVLLGRELLEMAVELFLTGLTGACLLFRRRRPLGCDQGVTRRLWTGLCHHRGADTQLFQRWPANSKGSTP